MSVRQAQGSLELQASEVAVIHAASRIFAALIRNGRLTNGNHSTLIRSSVGMALEIARETERLAHAAPQTGDDVDAGILDLLDEPEPPL